MNLKLRDKQFKTITFTERMLHKNLMVLKNKIYNIDIDTHTHTHTHTHSKKEKESKHNIKDSYQITREENKRGKKE